MKAPPPSTRPAHCRSCAQCQTEAFAVLLTGLQPKVVDYLDQQRSTQYYPKGSFLYRQGDTSRGVFCVNRGRIKVCCSHPCGKIPILRVVCAGEFLGIPSFMGPELHTNSAEMLTPGQVCHIPAHALQTAIEWDPRLALNFARCLANELNQFERRIVAMSCLTAPARIASLLLELQVDHPRDDGPILPLSRLEMALLAGTTVESVSRLLNRLGREGILRLSARSIFIQDAEALQVYIASCTEHPANAP